RAVAFYRDGLGLATKGIVGTEFEHGAVAFFELAGGWPGALVAQQVFRHKTRKLSYQLTFWLIVVLHQAFWIDLLFIGSGFTRERLDWLLRLI
ncbi:MAG: DUF1294 domain-containing protein, partial [Gammaproteobacteria bacterium]